MKLPSWGLSPAAAPTPQTQCAGSQGNTLSSPAGGAEKGFAILLLWTLWSLHLSTGRCPYLDSCMIPSLGLCHVYNSLEHPCLEANLPKPSPLTWCPPSPLRTLAPQFPLNPGQESHRMLRLELEASRGNWYAAWFFLFSLSLPSPHLEWQGPAEPLTGLLGEKKKSPAGASSSVGTSSAQRPKGTRHCRKRACLGGPWQACV